MNEQILHGVDRTTLPPAEYLPAQLMELQRAADAADERLDDFDIEHDDILAANWRQRAEAVDRAAGAKAVRDGHDPLKLRSEVERVTKLRPAVLGARQVFYAEAYAAENALTRAYRAVAASLEPKAIKELRARVGAAEEAYAAYQSALDAVGETVGVLAHARDWQSDGRRDWGPVSPFVLPNGQRSEKNDPPSALREGLAAWEVPHRPDPLVTVESLSGNGVRMELKRSQAVALGDSVKIISD
ncbi:hypothetical protein [Streptomyces shenzhenensis]|uniref:hypothetical protein n=1 Tax=Streptomyces shenzhenensis TaxID=943815 RepID=UPI0036B8753C